MADVKFIVTADDKGAIKKIEGLGTSLKNVKGQADKASPSFGKMFKQLAGGVIGISAVIAGFRKLKGFMTDVVEKAKEQERVETQLNQVLKSTGYAAGMTAPELKKMARELQAVTQFGDETIISGQNLLLTFTNIGRDVMPGAVETVLDMSVALGQDMKSSAIQVGKALNDPILGVTALRRVGVNFNETQAETIKKMVQSGQTMEAQKFILNELQTEFGGAARAAGETYGGSMSKLSNIWGDFKEVLGDSIIKNKTVLELIKDLSSWVKDLGEKVKKNQDKLQLYFSSLVTTTKTVVGALSKVGKALDDIFFKIGKHNSAWDSYISSVGTGTKTHQEAIQMERALSNAIREGSITVKEKWTLYNKYGKDWKAVTQAIAEGKEGEALKKLYDDVAEKTETLLTKNEELTTSHKSNLKPSYVELTQETKNWITELNNLYSKLGNLSSQLASGQISLSDYHEKLKQAKDGTYDFNEYLNKFDLAEMESEIEHAMTVIESEGSAIGSIFKSLGYDIFDAEGNMKDFGETSKTTATETKSFWAETADGLKTKWSEMFGDWAKSGDIFKGNFKGLMDGILTLATDTFGQMASKFMSQFVEKVISGAESAGSKIASNLAEGIGGEGTPSVKDAFGSVGKTAGGLLNTLSGISSVVTAVASVASLFKKSGGPSTTDSWHFENIWKNTKETRDWHFINHQERLDQMTQALTSFLPEKHDRTHKLLRDIKTNTKQMVKLFSKIKFAAKGASELVTRPTMFIAGEEKPEWVNITQANQPQGASGANVQVVIKPMPVSIEMDGRQVAMGVARFMPELSEKGIMKFNTRGLVEV